MSGALDVLQMKEEDVLRFPTAGTHLGGTNLDFHMEQQYIYRRRGDGVYLMTLRRTWKKMAPAIIAVENLANVSGLSSRNRGQCAGLKCAATPGATAAAGASPLEPPLTRSTQPSESRDSGGD